MIKYYDKSDGHYSDRTLWDPNKNYGNEYVNVHFRIEPFYQYPFNNYTEDQKREFYAEVREIFENIGWSMKDCTLYCREVCYEKQVLDIHPQDFTGEILKNNVSKIAEALNNAKTFTLQWVDTYQTVYDMTDEDYEKYLSSRDEEIKIELFEQCKTKRTNKYYPIFRIARLLSDKFRLTRIGLNDGRNYGSGQTIEHIIKIADKMVTNQYLIEALGQNGEKLIRSVNKTEQKKLKLNMDSVIITCDTNQNKERTTH